MFTSEGDSHSSAATRQRNDRDADFRCGANPQRGESSWAFRLKIYDPSPVSSPPATSGIATNSGENLPLIVPQLRALTDTRLTAMMENEVETAMRKPHSALLNSGYLRIYDGTQPTNADTAI